MQYRLAFSQERPGFFGEKERVNLTPKGAAKSGFIFCKNFFPGKIFYKWLTINLYYSFLIPTFSSFFPPYSSFCPSFSSPFPPFLVDAESEKVAKRRLDLGGGVQKLDMLIC